MADDDRDSNASSENEQDEAMEDIDNDDANVDPDDDNNEDNEDDGQDDGQDGTEQAETADEDSKDKTLAGSSQSTKDEPKPSSKPQGRPVVRPEALNAKLYDIVPTMAAPQATSVNCMSITPDLRYWFTGGSDGYIRKYNGPDTLNGKTQLTVAQRHPFVDSVVKAGVLMSYWGNEEPTPPNSKAGDDPKLSPVYSLAAHSRALWLLSGLQSGGINLQSVRHDEGKRICCLQQHTSAVSVLTLVPDEKGVLSGSWDKNVFDWDLNTGQVRRSFEGSGGQISAVELRPASGSPFPTHANETVPGSDTFSQNVAPRNGLFSNGAAAPEPQEDAQASPVHDSLFGGSDTGSLFGENDGGAFSMDDDNAGTGLDMGLQDDSMLGGDSSNNDVTMTGLDTNDAFNMDSAPAPPVQLPPEVKAEPESTPQVNGTNGVTNGAQANGARPSSSTAESQSQLQAQPSGIQPPVDLPPPTSPNLVFNSEPPKPQLDPGQADENTFFSAAIDGTIRIWDRRLPQPVARITPSRGVPPWCMGACWSPNGNWIYAGRRNGTVEEYNIHKARRGWEPERALKFPTGSGPVSAVRSMPNGRHLVCASHDILRLYDLKDSAAFKHSSVPFLIIPGPPRAGVISSLYIDPTARFMISAAGTRGWEGTSTEVIIGYEIGVVDE